MAPAQNPFGKMRKMDNPYIVLTAGDWEWRVLKVYQRPSKAIVDPYARVMVAARSPMTHGGWDMGDAYVKDVPGLIAFLRRHAVLA